MIRKFSASFFVGLLALSCTSNVMAGWGSWGASYGSYGGSTGGSLGSHGGSFGSYSSLGSSASHGSWGGASSGSNGSGGSGGSYGSHASSGGSWGGHHAGPVRRLFQHIHAKHEARRAWNHSYYASTGGSSGGSWGGSSGGSTGGSWGGSTGYGSTGYGSTGYGSTGYASTGGSTGTWQGDVTGDYLIEGEIHEGSGAPAAPPEMPTEAIPSDARREVRKGVLSVNVPEGAKVLVNGMTTQSTGSQRRYVSHGLKPGHSYRYEVTTVVEKDGQSVEETKTAVLRAGQVARLDFGSQSDDVRTSLTLNVPEDAKVFLSGSPTTSQGEVRRFSTQRISEGEKWQDYVVRVEVERNGHTLSKEQPVTLAGGDQLELDFSFADAELASNR